MATTLKSCQGQIASIKQSNYSFPYNTDLFNLMKTNSIFNNENKTYVISRLGVQADPGQIISVKSRVAGGESSSATQIKIGKTGIYQVNNVQFKEISFQKPIGSNDNQIKNVIIDYIIEEI